MVCQTKVEFKTAAQNVSGGRYGRSVGGVGGEGGVARVWGCERGGSEEERMDEILLVIGKKRGRESEREGEKVGKEVGSGERREKLQRICSNIAISWRKE